MKQKPPLAQRRWAPLIVGALLLAFTFLVSKSCAKQDQAVTQEQAVAIAREQIDYRPDGESIRFLRRGADRHPYWAVSLWQRGTGGEQYGRITVVVVDAESGEVTEVNREVEP